MQSYRQRRKKVLIVKIMSWILAVALLLVLVDMQMRPAVKSMAAGQAKLYAVEVMNEAVAEELARERISYDALIKLSRNKDGTVTAIESDMLGMNNLKVGITQAVTEKLSKLGSTDLAIPLGTLFGGQFFSGRGPMVNFRILNIGYPQSEITNRFDSAGINQTRHQVMLRISIKITALVPGYAVSTEAQTNICLAETVIVGIVPGAYTNIEGDQSDTISKINDYAAHDID